MIKNYEIFWLDFPDTTSSVSKNIPELKSASVNLGKDIEITGEYKLKRKDPLYRLQKKVLRNRNTKPVNYKE